MNILTIDLDIVMKPCINLYNDLVSLQEPKRVWDNIELIRNIDMHATMDYDIYVNLLSLFTRLIQDIDKSNIHFKLNHDSCLTEIIDLYNTNQSKINLYNIDHHHDIYYSDQQKISVDMYDVAEVGNWVWYLDKYNLLESYTWLYNSNSNKYNGEQLNCRFNNFEFNPALLEHLKFDKIFIVKSPQWVHPKFNFVFESFLSIANILKDTSYEVDKSLYCEGGYSRKPNLKEECK